MAHVRKIHHVILQEDHLLERGSAMAIYRVLPKIMLGGTKGEENGVKENMSSTILEG